ncbi:hypothetical protein STENM327S_02721 [Streptomyces tendae]
MLSRPSSVFWNRPYIPETKQAPSFSSPPRAYWPTVESVTLASQAPSISSSIF